VQVLTALSKLDNMHIIHADIKPDNLILAGTGRVKLIDLGCALHASQAGVNTYIQALSIGPRKFSYLRCRQKIYFIYGDCPELYYICLTLLCKDF
jgi:serine/threonine protein kinase